MPVSRYLEPDRPAAPAANLFAAATAYHVLLAHALAGDERAAPGASVLLLKRQLQANFRELFAALAADPAIPFRDVFLLERPNVKYKRRWRTVLDRMRAPALRRLVTAVRPGRLFLFNEDNLDQYLARRVRAAGGAVAAVEDGAVAYSDQRMYATRFERLQGKLLFGPRAQSVPVEGGSDLIGRFYARYPDQVRAELRRHPVAALPPIGLDLLQRLSWPADYLRRLDVDPESLRYEQLVLLAHRNNFKHLAGYAGRVRQLVTELAAGGARVAVSYHPRERQPDWLDLQACGAALIPHAVPAELVYLFNRARLRGVTGDIGTSLMTARWLLPDVPVVSLMDSLGIRAPALRRMLVDIGIGMR